MTARCPTCGSNDPDHVTFLGINPATNKGEWCPNTFHDDPMDEGDGMGMIEVTELTEPTPCLVCGRSLKAIVPESVSVNRDQPDDAVMCQALGNYGSTVYDPLGPGPTILFNICDPCFVLLKPKMYTIEESK